MSKLLQPFLPPMLVREINREPPRLSIIPLVTEDSEGFPHVALLSYFELFILNRSLFAFLYSDTRSTRFLRQIGRCTLIFVETDFVYYLKAAARSLRRTNGHEVFALSIHQVLEDFPHPDEGPVRISASMKFAVPPGEIEERLRIRREIMNSVDTL